MKNSISLTVLTLLLAVSSLSAATHYVSLGSTNPTRPYTTWVTAATNIQDAVNVAARNDVVLVTNGVYPGYVSVTNALALLSVNGPQFTILNGGFTNRCVDLTDGASLTGFTLTNGYQYGYGGGVACAFTSAGAASASTNGFLTNCLIVGNSSPTGGGAFGGTLYNCTLSGNSAGEFNGGGGAYGGTLYNCTLNGNSAVTGGGACGGTLYNCTLNGNSASTGGGADSCTLYNCTLIGNSGGADWSKLYNCIVYYNTASGGANYDSSSTLNYCCTTPLPTAGVGNLAPDPELASASHLSTGSPCRGAGSAAYATGTDIDGELWENPPSVGCDEYHVGAVSGPLTVGLVASYTNVLVGYAVSLTALIEGRTTQSVWDFGDGVVVSNRPYASHAWAAPGDYAVALRTYNEANVAGVSATVTIRVVTQSVVYVAASSPNPRPPYSSWATAARNIQDAVNAAAFAGAAVLVTNGVYPGSVSVTKPLTLLSVNGPQFTIINGGGTNRCVDLTDGASLTGFTLTNGYTPQYGFGGGVASASTNAFLTNCLIVGNSSYTGGGAYGGTLYNCTLSGNSALNGGYGGGASGGTLYNCTLTGNSAPHGSGGGANSCALYNCIVYFNTAVFGAPNYDSSSTLNYCCTTPLPTSGVGNLALDPQLASASHLSAGSPCRGAGSAAYATGTDIDGEPWGNPPAIGCDEYHVGAVTGPLTVGLVASGTNVLVGYAVSLTALIEGRTTQSVWDFGDGVVVSNRPYASHAWAAPGDYAVALRAYNEANAAGVSATVIIHVITQPVLYVAASSPNPRPPYASWATAATNIQDAVNAAELAGAAVLVTNGVYPGHVSVTNALALRSVNGPQFTIIDGGGPCVTLTDGASLTGFTLRNGFNWWGGGGGGVQCPSTNAWLSPSTNAFLTNCLIVGNLSGPVGCGGGAYGGTLYNCTLSGNSASHSGNRGGGAGGSTLYNCTLSDNSASYGGGADGCTLYNCTLSGNSADTGGGAYGGTLYNCTLSGNSARSGGGGVANSCALYNCIVYYNTAVSGAPNYDSSCTLNYCCTTPLPTTGAGNLALDPQLASATYLSAGSPCRGAGSAAYATATDIDGEPWGNPPSIGCDEYHVGAVTGPLTVALVASDTKVLVGYAVSLTALIEGRTTQSVWDFGDGVVVSNRPYASHAWAAPGDYAVALRAYNEANVAGVSATVTIHVITQPVLYVAASSPNPQRPYASWATAATNIQDAVNAASFPRAAVLVTNGVYPGSVSVTKPLTLRSVNGPQFTIINGGGVYLTDGASLTGFTLTGGGPGVECASTNAFLTNCLIVGNVAGPMGRGGGAYGGTLYNCTLSGNSVFHYCFGGGAYGSTLYNCVLSGNSAREPDGAYGGGASDCTLYNCTLSGNSASYGGGADGCTLYNCTLIGNSGGADWSKLYNCIVYYNTASGGANCDSSSTLNYCCATPLPPTGVGNITNGPLFVDSANGNLRLQSNSPCINAGNNTYVTTTTDLDGRPRIVGGTVDMGAYECQSPALLDFYNWLQTYALSTSASSVYVDSDGDGMNNWQEWVCGTNPTNALSVLRMVSALPTSTNATVTWQSVAGVNYFLERSVNPAAPFMLLATNILGQAGTTSYGDTNAAGKGPFFYRVGIRTP